MKTPLPEKIKVPLEGRQDVHIKINEIIDFLASEGEEKKCNGECKYDFTPGYGKFIPDSNCPLHASSHPETKEGCCEKCSFELKDRFGGYSPSGCVKPNCACHHTEQEEVCQKCGFSGEIVNGICYSSKCKGKTKVEQKEGFDEQFEKEYWEKWGELAGKPLANGLKNWIKKYLSKAKGTEKERVRGMIRDFLDKFLFEGGDLDCSQDKRDGRNEKTKEIRDALLKILTAIE